MNTLHKVVSNLKSDKIKERQEGLLAIREVFSREEVISNFHIRDGKSEPRVWLSVFQALFAAVLQEKLLVTKSTTKSSATAVRRLSDAVGVVRWLTERTAHLMNKRVVKALLEHLTQTMVHQNELFKPVALDYSKALKYLASHTQHLEHMEDHTWVRIVEMGFNVILDDPVKASFEDDERDDAMNNVESDMYVDDEESALELDDGDDLPSAVAVKGKKRARLEGTASPVNSPKMSQYHTKSKSKVKRKVLASVSLEQVEFASLLSILTASSAAPMLSADYPNLAPGILHRLQRFLERYPADSSLLHDYLTILSSTLGHLALNKRTEVEDFAHATWNGLLGLWGTKDKRMKEGLTTVLRILFQFLIAPSTTERTNAPPFNCVDGIRRLWDLLNREAESRWGVDGLVLESLRLELKSLRDGSDSQSGTEKAFVAQTFCAGWNFDAGQALSWAILELQADCAGKLYQLSESMHSTATPGSSRSNTKRTKLENPITALLHSFHVHSPAHVRSYHLQVLLFFIDRHWHTIHDALKQECINALLQYVAFNDGVIQSWVFLSFAAIAHAEGAAVLRKSSANRDKLSILDSNVWDPIWTHAIRRANVPAVCRAACHAGHTLLDSFHFQSTSNQDFLTSHRVLLEIETLAKDMDVQGPAYPSESVCMFLSLCLAIASQDVRLYRMRLEDKVLSWLIDSWKMPGNDRTKLSLPTPNDILLLLETVCGLAKRVNMPSQVLLPQCQIVDSVIEENQVKVIRDFLLCAKLPSFCPNSSASRFQEGISTASSTGDSDIHLMPPRGRERKVSLFFLRALDSLIVEWELIQGSQHHPTAETSRRSLDLAITAIAFESLLVYNGTTSNRQVMQKASRIIALVAPLLKDPRWTVSEKSAVALAFGSLSHYGGSLQDQSVWMTLCQPGKQSGIKEQTLRSLLSDAAHRKEVLSARQVDFMRLIWQNGDVQDALTSVISILRDVLRNTISQPSNASHVHQASDADDKDEFGPIRITTADNSPVLARRAEKDRSTLPLLGICVTFLTCGPYLQSASGEPTRDKELTELILGCAESQPAQFSLVCPIVFGEIRQGTLNLSSAQLASFLDGFAGLLTQYAFARSEALHRLVVDFLDSTLSIWLTPNAQADDNISSKVRSLRDWLSIAIKAKKFRTWTVRDALALFLDRYLSMDPAGVCWGSAGEDDDEDTIQKRLESLPTDLLPMMAADDDIRVRFRVAVLNARLFTLEHRTEQTPLQTYDLSKQWYTVDLDNYEHMLTRMLSLGNTMVVSSAVRRGPYWHLLETCLHTTRYSLHVEAILTEVSRRLGMPSLSVLFEAYASQLAYSIRQAKADFSRFPPHLLGYRDRKQYAEATFRAFTPTNIITDGRNLFEHHCRLLQREPVDGLEECFGDIVGFQIAFWVDSKEEDMEGLDQIIKEQLLPLDNFDSDLRQNVDGVVATILRALGEQDFSEHSAIVLALRGLDASDKSAQTFQALTRYRKLDQFVTHTPNLPAFPAQSILRSLNWLTSFLPDAFTKATTYHILQMLFKDIQHTPLVNEQNRLINAISLWIALRYQDFDDPTLLHTLVHGAILFFSQSDLARSAQSIIEWAFRRYRKTRTKDTRLPNILIRLCCMAHDYANNPLDRSTMDLGRSLLAWIDEQVYSLSKVTPFEPLIIRALPAWPQKPSEQLLKLNDEITVDSLSSVLSDYRITSNKFRLVRRLRDHAFTGDYSDTRYSRTDFWRLKECIPPLDRLQDEDVGAFAALLSLNRGQIGSFNIEQANTNAPRTRHARNFKRKTTTEDATVARDAITIGLLAMLEDDDPSHVSNAYNTLRLIMSVSSFDAAYLQMPSEYRVELDYLKTYRRSHKTERGQAHQLQELLQSEMYLDMTSNFSRWITMITVALSDALSTFDPFFGQLSSILTSDITFAEQILPILVHTLLYTERRQDNLASSFRDMLSKYFTRVLSSTCPDIPCVNSIVDTTLHLRYFSARTDDALAYNKWLDVDYTLLASSAILCGAYTTALLFLEVASEMMPQTTMKDASTEQILYEIYSHIDEPDGFYGIKTKDLHQFLVKRFHHERQWEKAFRFHGAALEAGQYDAGEQEGLLKSFHFFGFDHLAIDMQNSRGTSLNTNASSSMSYRLGWRTETWDLPERTENGSSAPLYNSLRAIYRERDSGVLDGTIRTSLYKEMDRMRSLGSENLAEIREVAQDLMCLSQIVQWRQDALQKRLEQKLVEPKVWKEFMDIDNGFGFSDLESLMATRISLIRSVRQREERHQIGNLVTPYVRGLLDIEKTCLLRLSQAARASGQVQIALNSVVRAQRLALTPSSEVSEEFANVLWLQKEEKLAVQFLQDVVNKNDTAESSRKATWLARLGTWTSEACLEKPIDIWARYFDPSITLLEEAKNNNPDSVLAGARVYRECAMFSERQYHATLKSPDAIRWRVYVDRKKQEIQHRNAELARTQTNLVQQNKLKNDQQRAQKLLNEDSELFRKHNHVRDSFLKQAIDMHSRCLQTSDAFDNDSAIRLCSLWFANFDDEAVLETVRTAHERIPSKKLVFLAHQLTARLASPTVAAELPKPQVNLQRLVVRMCQEHPFHSLYQVYCLQPDRHIATTGPRRQSGRHSTPSTQTERGAAASNIFDRLRDDSRNGQRVRDIEMLCDAYLQWAKYPIVKEPRFQNKGKSTSPFKIPDELAIRKISQLQVPVSTARTPLDATMEYNDCVWIDHYEHTFETAGGVNLPKISICHGSDGQRYKQLFKGEGNDDLRQDAVMEQVFELVNGVLSHDQETRRRELRVRDYKVIPLSTQAGLLEFVGNTSPMRDWLTKAHALYRPGDLKSLEFGTRMKKVQKEHSHQPDEQLRVFLESRKTFRPVLRHYFTEKHKTPISWFAMRLNYTRSVATTSIVGHVLGLGDRHISNILMDNVTGEVVHIDLGIAFDQGKLLPVPERVPFRMTADVVDGMGTSGTSGVFQRCAEETLRVLREESEVIMTVLEVFKHDPLHSWTASEVKVKQAQSDVPASAVTNDTSRFNLGIGIDMSSGSADEAADRALSSVARKLDKSLSVESTVNELIAEATDPMNLATIFYGWSPYM
ncbi:hypothetical protein B0H34DRAFT_744937 [Crassisporium funariophilum]|nr:hypothetical protein B0H34DRAFT_744937 [Crassisporium funariophilum]